MTRGSFAATENSTYDPNLGYLAFGGIAPVPTTGTAVTVPVQGTTFSTGGPKGYFFYAVDIDSYIFPGSKKLSLTGAGKQAILDTGTTLNYVPTAIAKAYNAQFKPAAKFVKDEDTYYVECDATVPSFEVVIGGKTFTIDGKDQISPAGTDSNGKELCISGTQDGGDPSDPDTVYIMGDVFLHNVVVCVHLLPVLVLLNALVFSFQSTFNIQSNAITLTQRKSY